MSNETDVIIGLIDLALNETASDSTKSELRAFRKQAEARQLQPDDRDYVIALCNRILRGGGSFEYPGDERKRAEEADIRKKGIESHRQAWRFFQAKRDMKWLYFDLVLKGALGDEQSRGWKGWDTGDELQSLAYSSLADDNGTILILEAARYIDRPIFHCTVLRDFSLSD